MGVELYLVLIPWDHDFAVGDSDFLNSDSCADGLHIHEVCPAFLVYSEQRVEAWGCDDCLLLVDGYWCDWKCFLDGLHLRVCGASPVYDDFPNVETGEQILSISTTTQTTADVQGRDLLEKWKGAFLFEDHDDV